MHVINAQKWTWCDRKHLSILRLCEKSETAAGQLYPLLPAQEAAWEENIFICRCHLGAAPQLYRCLLRGLFLAFISHGSFKSPHLIALRFPSQTLCVLQMHKTRSQHLRCPWVWTSHGIAAVPGVSVRPKFSSSLLHKLISFIILYKKKRSASQQTFVTRAEQMSAATERRWSRSIIQAQSLSSEWPLPLFWKPGAADYFYNSECAR